MHRLYPEIQPYLEEVMTTNDGHHHLWVAHFGNPQGLPVICLHGGPGAGTSPLMHRFFDPETYQIVCFDQRGCGRSQPSGSLHSNTTDLLLDDLDQITTRYNLLRYALFGGSWGATLALLCAARHPDRCLGVVLRGVFLNMESNLEWMYGHGASEMYPAAWADFMAPIECQTKSFHEVLNAYRHLLHADDEFTRLQAARAWNLWEYRLSVGDSQAKKTSRFSPDAELAHAQIEHHYLSQDCFLDPRTFSDPNAEIALLPMVLLHGANDHVCPLSNAVRMKELYPTLKLRVLDQASHCAFSPQMAEGLCEATQELAALYGH